MNDVGIIGFGSEQIFAQNPQQGVSTSPAAARGGPRQSFANLILKQENTPSAKISEITVGETAAIPTPAIPTSGANSLAITIEGKQLAVPLTPTPVIHGLPTPIEGQKLANIGQLIPGISPGEIPLRGGAALSPGEIPVRTAPPPSQAALLSSAAPTIPIPASSVPSAGTPAKPATTGPKLTGAVAPISTPTNVVSLANFVSNFIPTSPQFGGDFSATTENFVDSVTASTSVNRGAVGTTNLITGVAVQASASRIGAEAVEKFAARLASRAANGSSKFEMRLDPPQLGRIEVKIEVTSDNRVQAVLSAEHPDVLQDLQRGADALRRALLAEGFDLGSNDLEFHLEQQGQDTEQQLDPEAEIDGQALAQIMDSALANQFTEIDTGYGYWLVRDVKLDIRA